MKLRATCYATLYKTIEVDIPPSDFELWMEGSVDDERADKYADMISEALPSFREWDQVDFDEEFYEPCDLKLESTVT